MRGRKNKSTHASVRCVVSACLRVHSWCIRSITLISIYRIGGVQDRCLLCATERDIYDELLRSKDLRHVAGWARLKGCGDLRPVRDVQRVRHALERRRKLVALLSITGENVYYTEASRALRGRTTCCKCVSDGSCKVYRLSGLLDARNVPLRSEDTSAIVREVLTVAIRCGLFLL